MLAVTRRISVKGKNSRINRQTKEMAYILPKLIIVCKHFFTKKIHFNWSDQQFRFAYRAEGVSVMNILC